MFSLRSTALAAVCVVAALSTCSAFSPSSAPCTGHFLRGTGRCNNFAKQVVAPFPLRQSACNGAASVKMSGEGKLARLASFVSRASKGAAFGLALAASVFVPRPALAKAAVEIEADYGEAVTLYEPVAIKKAITLGTFGAAAGASVAVFGGSVLLAVKKEKKLVQEDIDAFERDVERMEQFKSEFLDGEVSDRSLFASLNKAMKSKLPEAEQPATTSNEDEFEKNVQAFLNEENAKAEKKKKPEFGVNKGGATLLERPDDIDGSKAEEWLNDVGFEDKPAEIDDEQLKRLQRMFGGDMPKL